MKTMTMAKISDKLTADRMTGMSGPVEQPGELYERFAAALNADDIDGIMMLFDPQGQTVPQPGQPPVIGLPAIREVMQQCLAVKPQIRYESMSALQTEDIALLRSHWRLNVMLPDGNPMELTGQGVQIARRQPDGSWRLLIDNPWAAEV
jgi:uncharacterized protein (TIGR02246 family)